MSQEKFIIVDIMTKLVLAGYRKKVISFVLLIKNAPSIKKIKIFLSKEEADILLRKIKKCSKLNIAHLKIIELGKFLNTGYFHEGALKK